MKKKLSVMLLAALMAVGAHAQGSDSPWSVNTRAWTTNYFTTAIVGLAETALFELTDNSKDSMLIERIIPKTGMVFPIGFAKKGFDYPYDLYTPYHRGFSNPLKYLGDYGIGIDVLYAPATVGIYAGAYFKSQEIVFANEPLGLDGENMRAFYFQPRVGLSLNFGKKHRRGIEAGVFFDVLTGGKGRVYDAATGGLVDVGKDCFKGGIGLDFALRFGKDNRHQQNVLQLSFPLHNFLNEDYELGGQKVQSDMKRRVGYIMLSHRIAL